MVDQESGTYRPRRAFVEPEPEPVSPPTPAAIPPAVVTSPTGPPTGFRAPAPDFVDEDAPKPLYRDEYAPRPLYRDETSGTDGPEMSDDTAGRSITFAPRPRRFDEDTTAILARSNAATGRSRNGRVAGDTDDIDDLDEDERKPLGERTRWALVLGAVAAVVVVGLAIGYAVFGVGNERGTVPPSPSAPGTGITAPTTGTTSDPSPTTGGVLLSDDSMLSPAEAKRLDAKRTWKVALNQRGASPDAPVAACFGTEPEDGAPVSQQKILRVLSSSGKTSPSALHEATSYATPEEAAQAYRVAARTLGTCPTGGTWIAAGRTVRGVGDQSASAIAAVQDGKTSWHSVLVSRTGRAVDIIDASRPGTAIPISDVADAMAHVIKKQCTAAGGKCADDVQVTSGPPPLGGDQPGYLATGDLPPVGGSLSPWNAAPIELPTEDFVGASCETVNWETVDAEERSTRVYLHPDSGRSYFGVNVILLTTENTKAATALVNKIKEDLETCRERRLTATVDDPKKVSGIGARSAEIAGYTAVVQQKRSDGGSDKFRVGIVAVGNKVAYTFANPKGDFDFTNSQWNTIAVRAGERVTQIT